MMRLPYRTELSRERLLEVLSYEPETGIFRWKRPTNERIREGSEAGTQEHGYTIIRLDGIRYRAHRLAFLYVKGEWPAVEVDHANMNRSDNRWGNLRLASSSQNKQNRGLQSNNTTGVRGVTRCGNRFRAQIKRNGQYKSLGYFDTIEEATEFRQLAAAILHGEFVHAIERS